MAQVVVRVNGRAYTMQCNDGEEPHLAELGELLDTEIERIRDAVGQVGDVRLLLMGGLVIADKLSDALKRIEDLEAQVRSIQASRNGAMRQGQELEETVAQTPRRRGPPAGGHGPRGRSTGGAVQKPGLRALSDIRCSKVFRHPSAGWVPYDSRIHAGASQWDARAGMTTKGQVGG
jgi:cell division protein ZapA